MPQPHVDDALGFVTLKYDPIMSFTKSSSDPLRKLSEVLSISILMPSNWNILSSFLILRTCIMKHEDCNENYL